MHDGALTLFHKRLMRASRSAAGTGRVRGDELFALHAVVSKPGEPALASGVAILGPWLAGRT